MRFRLVLADSSDPEEERARARTLGQATELWTHLGEQALSLPAVDQGSARRLREWLAPRLERLAPGLVAEVAPFSEEFHVTLTPGSEDGLDPLASELVACARAMPRLRLARHRAPLHLGAALQRVRARTGLDLAGARVRVGFSRGHLLEVLVKAPAVSSGVDDAALEAADLLVLLLLGDQRFDDWVGAVDVAPLPRPSSLRVLSGGSPQGEGVAADELAPSVFRAIDGALESLPEAPYHVAPTGEDWVLFELEPERGASGGRLGDVVLFSTRVPEAMRCFLEGARFSSCRFSRHGERFLYVAAHLAGLAPEERLAARGRMEHAATQVLVPDGLGAVVGAGIGLEHVYLVVALAKLEPGLAVLQRSLVGLALPGPAWILCCDSAWAFEWLGVGTSRPPPFLPA